MKPCPTLSFSARACGIVLTVIAWAATAWAGDWTQFRGPQGHGRVDQLSYPVKWSGQENVAWSSKVPGTGWSTPVVAGDHVFITSAVFEAQPRPQGFQGGVSSMRTFREDAEANRKQTTFELHCLRLKDGELLWSKTAATKVPAFGIHPSNTYATESPATDGTHVYVYFAAAGVVAAFDMEGEKVWSQDIGAHPSGNGFGSGSSLVLSEGRLFVQCDNDENSFGLALDAKSGQEIWKISRETKTSWSTPLVWKNHKRTELVFCGAGRISGHALDTGDKIWELNNFDGSFSASPAADEKGIYFGNSGPRSTGPLVSVAAGAVGDLVFTKGQSEDWLTWARSGSGPGLSSPVAYEGLLYVVAGSGMLNCYDTATGDRVYQERLPGASRIAASLWIAGDKLFVLDESGKTFVVETGRKFEVMATNTIDDLFWSTPAVAGDSLILRGADKVYCVRAM